MELACSNATQPGFGRLKSAMAAAEGEECGPGDRDVFLRDSVASCEAVALVSGEGERGQ